MFGEACFISKVNLTSASSHRESDPIDHLTAPELEHGLDAILRSPPTDGRLELLVRRPAVDEREVLDEGELDQAEGLVGDRWGARGANPDVQLTLMNARVIALLARVRERWPLAGDQLYVDLDLSRANLPPGTRLRIGSALIEVTAEPHTGCKKFAARFGVEAVRFVSTPVGKSNCLRGINARVVEAGTIRRGDAVRKVEQQPTAGT